MSVRQQLLLLVAVTALPLIIGMVWLIQHEVSDTREEALLKLRHVNEIMAGRIQTFQTDQRIMLELAADEFRGDPPALSPKFNPSQFVRIHPHIVDIGAHDLRGANVYSLRGNPNPVHEALGFPWVQEGLVSNGFRVGGVFLGPRSELRVTQFTHPVTDASGRRTGFLNLSVDLWAMQDHILMGLPSGYLLAVLDKDFNFLMRSQEFDQWIGKPLNPKLANFYRDKNEGFLSAPNIKGETYLWSFIKMGNSRWTVSVGLPEARVFGTLHVLLVKSVLFSLLVLGLMLAAAWIIATRITRPILTLASTAQQIGAGDTSLRAAETGPAEISVVATQFNAMLEKLEQSREEREALALHYGTMIKNARDIILLIDEQGKIVEANDAATAAYGYSQEELGELTVRDLRTSESQPTVQSDWQKSANPEGVMFETRHRRRDGSSFPVEVSSRAFMIDGKLYRQSFIRDTSTRESSAAEMARNLDELRRWHKAMLNREERIIELKQEINRLLAEAGKPPRFSKAETKFADPADE